MRLGRRSTPPRLIVRTVAATFTTVALLLAAVFVGVSVEVGDRVRRAVADRLATGQRIFSTLEARRQHDLVGQVGVLADSPMLKAALDTYATERPGRGSAELTQLHTTVQREIERIASRFDHDVIAVTDASRRTVAVAGRQHPSWPVGFQLPAEFAAGDGPDDGVVALPSGYYRIQRVPLMLGRAPIGNLYVGTALDARYATALSELSGAETAILHGRQVLVTTLESERSTQLAHAAAAGLPREGVIALGGEAHALRSLFRAGDAEFYAISPIEPAAAAVMRDALASLGWLASGAILLAGLASLVLARTLTRPIDQLTRAILAMRDAGRLEGGVALTGSSREVDALAHTFNDLITSVEAAQQETRAASVGAIRALAAALDARDPYTAGHSERVSAISVAIGREIGLADQELEVLRLGALLHDIGKIGVSDEVLRKPARLSAGEFELLKRHTTLGARILGPVPFLAPQIPIVELHHECPDGSGYPHALRGEQIPPLARIVHVADAFDAITSARAYRPARTATEALAELWRCSGTQFDAEVVAALVRIAPGLAPVDTAPDPALPRLLPAASDLHGMPRARPSARPERHLLRFTDPAPERSS
jgi:putative nucleotidyltransferase with HDIG domain